MATDLYYPESLKDATLTSEDDLATVASVKFTIFDRPDSSTSNLHRQIVLYMPEQLENPSNVSWDSTSVGPGGAEYIDNASYVDVQNLWNSLTQRANEFLATGRSKLSGGSEADANTLVSLSSKKIKNPYLKMVFRGLNFRNFRYTFRFTPHNQSESKVVHEIIQEFRSAALPSNGGSSNSWKLGYPRELQIEYLHQGKTHQWLNKFKRCVITDLNVNYAGQGFYVPMRDGFPAMTELLLTFSEIDLVYREDINSQGESY